MSSVSSRPQVLQQGPLKLKFKEQQGVRSEGRRNSIKIRIHLDSQWTTYSPFYLKRSMSNRLKRSSSSQLQMRRPWIPPLDWASSTNTTIEGFISLWCATDFREIPAIWGSLKIISLFFTQKRCSYAQAPMKNTLKGTSSKWESDFLKKSTHTSVSIAQGPPSGGFPSSLIH